MDKIIHVATRALAVAVVAFFGAWTVTAPFGGEAWQAGLVSAGTALVMIGRDLALAYAKDGELSDDEIEEAFRIVNDESN